MIWPVESHHPPTHDRGRRHDYISHLLLHIRGHYSTYTSQGYFNSINELHPFFFTISTFPSLCQILHSSIYTPYILCCSSNIPMHSSRISNSDLCCNLQTYIWSTVQKCFHYGNMVVVTGHMKCCEPILYIWYLIEKNKFKYWLLINKPYHIFCIDVHTTLDQIW